LLTATVVACAAADDDDGVVMIVYNLYLNTNHVLKQACITYLLNKILKFNDTVSFCFGMRALVWGGVHERIQHVLTT